MQALVLAMILSATTFRFLREEGFLPGAALFSIELFAGLSLIYVIANGIQGGFRYVRPAYWFLFGAIVVDMVCGAVVNQMEPGPIIAGLRIYLRAVPLFFLPAVVAFSAKQLRVQLLLLAAICTVQLPLAYVQRMRNMSIGGSTGDTTYGTMMISSILSIFLICAISIVLALYLKKKIRMATAAVLFLIFLIPTTLNETKGTLLLLPLAVIVTFMTDATPGRRLKTVLLATGVLVTFAAVFVPIYNQLIQVRKYPTTIEEFFTKEGRLEGYIGTGSARVGETEQVGRADTIVAPVQFLASDPAKLVFGLGPGNATESSLGEQFTGRYFHLLEPFLFTSVAMLIAELGLLGVLLVFLLHWMLFRDARMVAATRDDLTGAIALGWTGVVTVFTAGLFYKDLIPIEGLSCLFWFYSGVVAAERMRLSEAARTARQPLAPLSDLAGAR
jgi:hypothetical protein